MKKMKKAIIPAVLLLALIALPLITNHFQRQAENEKISLLQEKYPGAFEIEAVEGDEYNEQTEYFVCATTFRVCLREKDDIRVKVADGQITVID